MNVTVIGLGKMGASLCADLKEAGFAATLTGVDSDPAAVDYCVSQGIVDEGFTDAALVPSAAGICVLAVPVERMGSAVEAFFSVSREGVVVTDVGSVKSPVIKSVQKALPPGAEFVPAHPVAGDEKHGARSFKKGIYKGKPVVITGGAQDAVRTVERMWEKTGAVTVRMDSEEHDRLFAFISHLPHVCAYSLAAAAASGGKGGGFPLSGGGLKDTTRIAMSDPALWAGILLENSEPVLEAIEVFSRAVEETASAVRAGDRDALVKILERGRAAKAKFP